METRPYPIRSYLLTLLFCLVVSTTLIKAQTDFAPGEIIFTGYNSDDPDAFSFVLLQDVLPSTVIFITDRGWTVANTRAQTILVNDQTPPSITCRSDVTIDNSESTDPQNTGNASGQDNCGGSPGGHDPSLICIMEEPVKKGERFSILRYFIK